MTETIQLPTRLVPDASPDLRRLNAALRAGTARLDWSATREATPEALAILVASLDLGDDAEALGLGTVPAALVDPLMAALEGAAARHGTRLLGNGAAGKQAATGQGRTPTHALWSAPRPVQAELGVAATNGAPPPVATVEPTQPTDETAASAPLLAPPASAAMRDELERLVLADLLGPAGGEEEEITDRPRDRYLVGLLAPRDQSVDREAQDELAEGGSDSAEDGAAESSAPASPSMFPSSLGLTCCVEGAATALVVRAAWGAYERVKSAEQTTKTGSLATVWRRVPLGGSPHTVPLEAGKIAEWSPDPASPDVHVRGVVRQANGAWIVTLWLVNDQVEPERLRDSAWLFQPELRVEAPDGAAIFRRRAHLRPGGGDAVAAGEDRELAMLYRRHLEFAVGHGVGLHAEHVLGDTTCATRITTRVVPTYEVAPTTSGDERDFPALTDMTLDMATLAAVPDGGFGGALAPLVDAYDAWIADQGARLGDPDLADYADCSAEALANCRIARDRIREGIALLDREPQAARAFRFANEAMWRQRINTLVIARARDSGQGDRAAIDVPKNRSWRLFQLAFILLNLPSLTDLHHPERGAGPEAGADLLWFPTGGGKTEAYLGLTAYTLGIRRLQGTVAGRSGMDGVAVLMRYTLRLLTLQQFQRAAALICACEMIRREAAQSGDRAWGETPFRLGLWVGQRATPNTTAQAGEAVKKDHGAWNGGGGSGSPAQLTNCPWCGAAIDPGKHITVDKDRKRTFVYCGDPHGDCPFTAKRAPFEGLPVIVVDEEIYRRLPALLIATVDKFAQMPWKGETQMLFGQVDGYCPRHGFRSPEVDDSDSHPAKGGLPRTATVPHGPLRPPDLIIQDELHLISGPLGTLVGLYETVVDRLCSWDVQGQRVRPKVIASTATVRRAPDQLHALFLRRVAVFPPQGLDAEDNFFARQRAVSEGLPGRKYIGICAPGVRLKAVLIRVYVAHLAAAQVLYEKYGAHADPWMTLVGYFNAMRELGGMRRLVEDDVHSHLKGTAKRGLANRDVRVLEELTSRKGSTDIPRVLQQLEAGFDPERQRRAVAALKAGKKSDAPPPVDVLLATNMISVGVDVPRLGLMVLAGQPKTTAEYIQATSRVGRQHPGLVCTVFNWTRPRDLSHYEQFEHYHDTFYQHVEALSVTPFAARALDRGLSGLLVAYLRLIDTTFNANLRASRVDRTSPYVAQAIEDIATRAGQVTNRQDVANLVRAELNERVDEWIASAQRATGGATLGYQGEKDGVTVPLLQRPDVGPWSPFTCLNSLRDVEPTVKLILDGRGPGADADRPFVPVPKKPTAATDG
jgi:hypothetical protein